MRQFAMLRHKLGKAVAAVVLAGLVGAASLPPAGAAVVDASIVEDVLAQPSAPTYRALLVTSDRGAFANVELFLLEDADEGAFSFAAARDEHRNLGRVAKEVRAFRVIASDGSVHEVEGVELRPAINGGIAGRVPTADVAGAEFEVELEDGRVVRDDDTLLRLRGLPYMPQPEGSVALGGAGELSALNVVEWTSGSFSAYRTASGCFAIADATQWGYMKTDARAQNGCGSSAYSKVTATPAATANANLWARIELRVYDQMQVTSTHYSSGAAWTDVLFSVEEYGGSWRTLNWLVVRCESSPFDPGSCSESFSGTNEWASGTFDAYAGVNYAPRVTSESRATAACTGTNFCYFAPPASNTKAEINHVTAMRLRALALM